MPTRFRDVVHALVLAAATEERLFSPVQRTKAAPMAHAHDAETAFAALAKWWNDFKDRTDAGTVSDAVLRDYFNTVETVRPVLYATDLIAVGDLRKELAAATGTYVYKQGAPTFRSPLPYGTSDLTAYMYTDPLLSLYYDSLIVCPSSKKGSVSPARADRCHVLDQKAALTGDLNVKRSLYTHVNDAVDRGLPVVPEHWEHDVSNLVRKARFSNSPSVAIWWYPDDLTLDNARKHVNDLPPGDRTSVDTLIAMWHAGKRQGKKGSTKPQEMVTFEGTTKIPLKVKHPDYERRVRQAQALRYAAQWARATLAAKKPLSGEKTDLGDALIAKLQKDTSLAIDELLPAPLSL